MSPFPSSNTSDSSSVTLPPGPSSSIPQRDEIDWEDDMVVDDPDPVLDQAVPNAPQSAVSSSLGPLVPCMVNESVTSARRDCTKRKNNFGGVTKTQAPRNQFHAKSAIHYHYGGDNSSAPSASIWGQMTQYPWFPAPPATNAAIHGHMPWPYAFSPQVHGNGPWFPPFPSWNGAQPSSLPWPAPGAVCDAFWRRLLWWLSFWG